MENKGTEISSWHTEKTRPEGRVRLEPLFQRPQVGVCGRYLRNVGVVFRRISAIVTRLPLPFIPHALDEILVEVTDIQVPYLMGSKGKSELPIPQTQHLSGERAPLLFKAVGREGTRKFGPLLPGVSSWFAEQETRGGNTNITLGVWCKPSPHRKTMVQTPRGESSAADSQGRGPHCGGMHK